jgi:leucyl-tRNA synthetase
MSKQKSYDHKAIEPKLTKEWEQKKLYETKTGKAGKTFYGLVEFPFPSGAGLHTGHVRSYVAMDIVSRKRRMEGYNVLYPMGWDAFGLPTENYAIKTGMQPQLVTKQNTDTFRKQLKALGLGFDWSREVNTTDPAYYKWTQWIFLEMYKKGLAYKAKTTINWCPKDKIGLANEEVIDGKCERCGTQTEKREKEQWMLAITKYADRLDKDLDDVNYLEKIKIQQRNWIGRSEGSLIPFQISAKGAKAPKKVLIGTRNEAKIKMVKECFPKNTGIELISLNDIPKVDDSKLVEGPDFRKNAKMKAEFYFKKTGIPTLSTDNVFWVEKWPKDGGIITHMRKEANPKSDRATDEEVIAFFQKWLKKVGDSKAHFIFALAYTDEHGTKETSSTQREYIFHEKRIKGKFWDGYPTECLLSDAITGVCKGNQTVEERYSVFMECLKNEVAPWMTGTHPIEVFTTRADTLFGVTYVVLAPEHALVKQLLPQVKNRAAVEEYIKSVKNKTDIERTAEEKEKTGVALEGIVAKHPATGAFVPVWIADYVLASYGTGAVMAVPAHDERDHAFAKKYNLPIKIVVDEKFWEDRGGEDTIKPNEPFVTRTAIAAIIRNPKDNTYLTTDWKTHVMHGLVTGGVEAGEDLVEAALREIHEETGYKHVKFVRDPKVTLQSFFYHRVKKQNRRAHFKFMFFDLIDEERDPIDEKELAIHNIVWKKASELKDYFTVIEGVRSVTLINNPEYIFTDDGILVDSGEFTDLDSAEARKKITEAVGGKLVTKYKLRDWVFSRQRYWGEPIPMVKCASCGWVPVPEKELPITLPKVKKYEPTDNGESPLAEITSWVKTKCPKCKGKAERETDTMPNWAGSSWYFLRYTDPKNKKEFASKKALKYWMKNGVDWYNGGMEHTTLHLLYSRFWHKFLYDLKLVPTAEPYMKRTSHGMILAEGGEKMSKSKGNTVNPDDIIKNYGADTLRLYEMFMGPFDQSVAWSTNSIVGPRRFIERLYRLQEKASVKGKTSNEIVALLHKTIKKVGEDIESTGFNTAVSACMILLNEMEKAESVNVKDFKLFLQILAPFIPYVADKMWRELGEKKSIHLSKWPKFDPKKFANETIKIVVQVNGKIRTELVIQKEMDQEAVKAMALKDTAIIPWIEGKEVKRIIYVPGRLVNIVV